MSTEIISLQLECGHLWRQHETAASLPQLVPAIAEGRQGMKMLHPSGFPGRIYWGRMQLSIWKFSMTETKPAVRTETPSPSHPFYFNKAIGVRVDGWVLILPPLWSWSKTAINNLKPSEVCGKREHKPSHLLFVKAPFCGEKVIKSMYNIKSLLPPSFPALMPSPGLGPPSIHWSTNSWQRSHR